jgi:hypothetical protein
MQGSRQSSAAQIDAAKVRESLSGNGKLFGNRIRWLSLHLFRIIFSAGGPKPK